MTAAEIAALIARLNDACTEVASIDEDGSVVTELVQSPICLEAAAALAAMQARIAELEREPDYFREQLWQVYEAIYGHREAEGIDAFGTAVRAVSAVVKHREELRIRAEKAEAALAERDKVIEAADAMRDDYPTKPGTKNGMAYDAARAAIRESKP